MELDKIGAFLTALRKEKGLTQEQLGEQIGVTNKTISRWETVTYLPPADALLQLSALYGISINEILSGQRLSEAEYQAAAEENLVQTIRVSSFSRKERMDYFKRKWFKDHLFGVCLWLIGTVVLFVIGFLLDCDELLIAAPVVLVVGGLKWNNAMLAYIESHVFTE